jgi:PIN like domain
VSLVRVAIDFNCTRRWVGALEALYGHRGFKFLHMETLVAGPTRDEIWADAFKKFGGHVVISGDCKIAYKPHLAIAFIDNGFISFFPEGEWSRLPGHMRDAVIVNSWPRIETTIRTAVAGTLWRIPCGLVKGELRLSAEPLKQLVIPDDVLQEARRKASGGQGK